MGQIYIASVNWILMFAAIGLVLAFKESSNLAAAYGVSVTTTMLITTLILLAFGVLLVVLQRGVAQKARLRADQLGLVNEKIVST